VKVGIFERLWNWCPRPKKRVLTSFTRLVVPLYVPILIGSLVLTAYVAVIFLPSIISSDGDESGWVIDQEMERVEFPGGSIVIFRRQQDPRSARYITVKVFPNIQSESDLWAYVESRTKAMNELLDSINPDESLQITLTFNAPLEPVDFQNFCKDYLEKPNLYAILLRNGTDGTLGVAICGLPPLDVNFVNDFEHLKKDYTLIGVIASEGLLKACTAKTVQSDSRVVLVDPAEDLTTRGLVEKYLSTGLYVGGGVEEILFSSKMWSEYAKLKYGVTWVTDSGIFEPELGVNSVIIDELLGNPSKYHGYRIHVFGTVRDLRLLKGPVFKLDGRLLVCYAYDEIDLYPTNIKDRISNGDYVSVIGRFFFEEGVEGSRSTLYAEKIEKA